MYFVHTDYQRSSCMLCVLSNDNVSPFACSKVHDAIGECWQRGYHIQARQQTELCMGCAQRDVFLLRFCSSPVVVRFSSSVLPEAEFHTTQQQP